MQKRLFLGIPIPQDICRSIHESIEPLQHMYSNWRWVREENYHITVSFFGTIEEGEIPALTSLIQPVIEGTQSFSIHLSELFLAPPISVPRMLWALGRDTHEFANLVTVIETTVSRNVSLPHYRNGHAPLPHITLARFDKKQLDKTTISLPNIHFVVPVTSCILFESLLSTVGPHYTTYKEFALKSD